MSIRHIRVTHHLLPLDPPLSFAWDPRPRDRFTVMVVEVESSTEYIGVGAGDPMYDLKDYLPLLLDTDPTDLLRHSTVFTNIDFHSGRPWPLEVALWDIAGQMDNKPVWKMIGGRKRRIQAYASSALLRPPDKMAALALRIRDEGFPALKIRFGRESLAADFEALAAVRAAVGDTLELMVDCNQGWRTPWDTRPAWTYRQALEVARELEQFNVYWLEGALHHGDYDGMARLRANTSVRIAGGGMTREYHEFRTMLERECLDVYQPDVVRSLGMTRARELAAEVEARGYLFTPHAWGNGHSVIANAHFAAGCTNAPFIEYPYDPPEWTPERRDFLLRDPVYADAEGWLNLSDSPGLGVKMDNEKMDATLSHERGY